MARDRGEYYAGADANRGQLGALMNLQGSGGGGEAPSLAQLQQPTQAAPEDMEVKKQQNMQWLQDPRTQAALATFAMGIMQPLGANADAGDFMGLLANSMGNATRAAAGVEEATLAEQALRAKMAREDFELGLKVRADDRAERQFDRQGEQFQQTEERLTRAENRELLQLQLDAKEKRLSRQDAARKQELEEKKAMVGALKTDAEIGKIEAETEKTRAETKKLGYTKASRVISGKDELNSLFNLGLQPDQQARVVIESDEEGRIVGASIEGSFGNQPEPSPLAKLQQDRQKAIDAGKTKEAAEIQRQIDDITTAGATASGVLTIPDAEAPGGMRQQILEGGKTALEAQAEEEKKAERRRLEESQIAAVQTNISDAIRTIETPREIIGIDIPPDMMLTGIGSISKLVPGTPAADLSKMLDPIGARLQLSELQRMREASPTGGALGNVSNFEGMTLREAYYSLYQGQTAAQLLQNLKRFQTMFDDVLGGGQLSAIGKQVQEGKLTPEAGEAQANALFGGKADANVVSDPETEINVDVPPEWADQEMKDLWPYISLGNRQRMLKEGLQNDK